MIMKTKCPYCQNTKCRRLITGVYYCDNCTRFFLIDSEFLVIMDGEEPKVLSTIPGITAPMITRKLKKDNPYIFIGIGEKGISKDLLSKKIMRVDKLTKSKKLSILKELDIEL